MLPHTHVYLRGFNFVNNYLYPQIHFVKKSPDKGRFASYNWQLYVLIKYKEKFLANEFKLFFKFQCADFKIMKMGYTNK
jgi:hypothetical protein